MQYSSFKICLILKNDFSENLISELIEDIHTYGSISSARIKIEREYEKVIWFKSHYVKWYLDIYWCLRHGNDIVGSNAINDIIFVNYDNNNDTSVENQYRGYTVSFDHS